MVWDSIAETFAVLRQLPAYSPTSGLIADLLATDSDPIAVAAANHAEDCARVALGVELALLDSAADTRPTDDQQIADNVATLRRGTVARASIDAANWPLLAGLLAADDGGDPIGWVADRAAVDAATAALRVLLGEVRAGLRDIGGSRMVSLDLPFTTTSDPNLRIRPTNVVLGPRGLRIVATARIPDSTSWWGFTGLTDDRGLRYLPTDCHGHGPTVEQTFHPAPAADVRRLTLRVDGYEVADLSRRPDITFRRASAHARIELPI